MIYIHIPFCHRKCNYCAFYSLAGSQDKERYIDALCHEIEQRSMGYGKPIKTLYLGGGTPTQLSIAQLTSLVETLRSCFDLSQIEEATIECNPEDLSPSYLEALASLRLFNRISMGVQSFRDSDLATIGRIHTGLQARNAIENAYMAGFHNITIDLIYGLPNQTLDDWQVQLQQLATLPIQHLSCYALTVEPHTLLEQQIRKKLIQPATEATAVAQYEILCQWAAAQGWEQYEVSNFCKDHHYSRHNSRYWDRTPYLGFGAAAHSFDGLNRRWNYSNLRKYCEGIEQGRIYYEEEQLTLRDAFNEYMMTALRTTRGIEKKIINTQFPNYTNYLAIHTQPYLQSNLLIETDSAYQPTSKGLLHADGIASELFILEN